VIELLTPPIAAADRAGLEELLIDAVASGASVSFLPPIGQAEAGAFWQGALEQAEAERRVIMVARDAGRRIVGCITLNLDMTPNQQHRADVQKLLVHTRARRQGVARRLIERMETEAHRRQRTLLVLDTNQGEAAEALYRRLGYSAAGAIPNFSKQADGSLRGTVIFYKEL
jgi:ribosomal protein S18 acetylase RimI-like enzyme